MKKLLTVMLAVAMLASIACVATFAADPAAIKVGTDGVVNVEVGTTEVNVPVTLDNVTAPEGLKAAKFDFTVTGATVKGIDSDLGGNWENGDIRDEGTFINFMWVGKDKDAIKNGDTIATVTVTIPADAKAGDEFAITLAADQDLNNWLLADANETGIGGTAQNGKIVVVEKAVPTDTDTPKVTDTDTPKVTDTDTPKVTDTDKPVATDKPDDTTKAPANNKPAAPSTGDAAIVVVAAMVVALGTAIVVKKVNVK